jgi:hypothetical protein
MRFVLAIVAGMSAGGCIENGSRTEGHGCWNSEDCRGSLVCDPCKKCRREGFVTVGLKGREADEACDEVHAIEQAEEAEAGDTIVCLDGEPSPTCTTCERGCCEGHGGCL